MSIVWSALALGVLQLAAGIAIGWSLARRGQRSRADEAVHLRALAADLRGLIQDVHGQVDDHHSRMRLLSEHFRRPAPEDGDGKTASTLRSVSGMIVANERLQKELAEAERKLARQEAEIVGYLREARTDALTRLPNRRAFDDVLLQQTALHDRNRLPVCLLMIDVDRFKELNDRWGHPFGDEVLRRVAGTVRHAARQTDFVARVGGEEFAVVMAGAEASSIPPAAERIRRAVEDLTILCGDARVPVTISLGAARIGPGESARSLVARADAALYASKEAGRNRGHWHDGQRVRPIAPPPAEPVDLPALAAIPREPFGQDPRSWRRVCDDLRRRLTDLVAGEG